MNNTNSVYVIVANNVDGSQFCKIGVSTGMCARVNAIQTGCPLPIDHVLHLPIPQGIISTKVERHLHRRFKAFHTSGEWFRFNMADRAHQAEFDKGCREVVDPILGKGWKWTRYTVAELKENGTEQTRQQVDEFFNQQRADAYRLQQRVNKGNSPTFWPEDCDIGARSWEPGKKTVWA